MCYCPTPTLHLNLALTGDSAFIFSPKKPHSVWFISVLNYGYTENVLINHLLLVIPMLYPCHYTNLCPHKPHKHAHTHTHTAVNTHTHTHCEHTQQWTHTHTHTLWTHTRRSGQPFMLRRPGKSMMNKSWNSEEKVNEEKKNWRMLVEMMTSSQNEKTSLKSIFVIMTYDFE